MAEETEAIFAENEELRKNVFLTTVDAVYDWGRRGSMWPVMFGLACCAIEMIATGVKVGQIYNGRVTSIKDFGAFIEVAPGQDGLCHISELADGYVNAVSDVCRIGDEMRVKVILVDDQGRVKLSRKAVLREEKSADATTEA